MKKLLIVLMYIVMTNNLWAVNNYSTNDNLYAIAENINIRSEPNLTSQIIDKLSFSNIVTALETKYNKSGDITLEKDTKKWESIITGKWTKIKFENKVGYVFDAYLSHYNFKEITSHKLLINHDTISVPDYQTYTRSLFANGVIQEIGIGMEWGLNIYMIPDFTFEEAILFIKPATIDKPFRKQTWLISKDKIELKESDGTSYYELEIVKFGEYVLFKSTDGV